METKVSDFIRIFYFYCAVFNDLIVINKTRQLKSSCLLSQLDKNFDQF